MKSPARFLLHLIIICVIFTFSKVSAQIGIVSGNQTNPVELVQKIVGPGIQYDNVTYQGAGIARGYFYDGEQTDLGFDSGIFLTSGSGSNIPGPNQNCSASVNNGLPGDPTLNAMTTSITYDASVLQFDFVPQGDTLIVKYVFGSEEYNEGVGISSSFSDVCGIFVTGPNPEGGMYSNKNIATVPGTVNTPVNSNTINNGNAPCSIVPTGPCTNCAYFHDNTNGLTLEYDGLTVVMTAWLLVIPSETYAVKIGVADCGDGIFDSGIFIEENSFSVRHPALSFEVLLDPPGLTENMVEGHVNANVIFRLAYPINTAQTLHFEIGGTAVNGVDYEQIADSVNFEYGMDSTALTIIPYLDATFEGDESIKLIVNNLFGWFPIYDTLELIIEDYNALSDIISPPTITCQGCEVSLWVEVFNGYPPYTYLWEPGGFTSDSIMVTPDTTTSYYVTYTDLFGETGQDSTKVIVFPTTDFSSFLFEASLNPGLAFDIVGEILEDSVLLHLPAGADLQNLIASFTCTGTYLWVSVDGVHQETGVTPNDFTSPVMYTIMAPGMVPKEYTVIADIETGNSGTESNEISVFPNPVSEKLIVRSAIGTRLTVINSMGLPVMEKEIHKESQTLNLENFENGIYFLKFETRGTPIVKRFVISR